MATTIEGAFTVPADQRTVWEALNNPRILKTCISGCHVLEKDTPTAFRVVARVKVGPFSASFRGGVLLEDVDAPNGCRIIGEGQGGIAGFAKGVANVRLREVPDGTLVSYDVDANLGGRIAQIAGRLVDGLARRMADRFFVSFTAELLRADDAADTNITAARRVI